MSVASSERQWSHLGALLDVRFPGKQLIEITQREEAMDCGVGGS